jgi:hypothetical protein
LFVKTPRGRKQTPREQFGEVRVELLEGYVSVFVTVRFV